jgi:hypothetical protein
LRQLQHLELTGTRDYEVQDMMATVLQDTIQSFFVSVPSLKTLQYRAPSGRWLHCVASRERDGSHETLRISTTISHHSERRRRVWLWDVSLATPIEGQTVEE